jgi:hypothetical protein
MSSVIRYTREPTPLSHRFTVFPYHGVNNQDQYFTVTNESLYRIHADLTGNTQWIVARDMGKESAINTIDPVILADWETQNTWTNITILRKGRARKFQLLAIPNGDFGAADNNGPAWNAAAYTDPSNDFNANQLYNNFFPGINDLLIVGNDTTSADRLPFGTFWAVIDPIVIQYTASDDIVYRRAIVNRVNQS